MSSFESKEILVEFIECYRANEMLWDTTNKDYLNRNKKISGYYELLDVLKKTKTNATIADVKRKINTLRSAYRKELRKIKHSECSGTAGTYVPTLWWYDSMTFIEHFEKPVEFISTMNDHTEEDSLSIENESLPPSKKIKTTTKPEKLLSMACDYLDKDEEENKTFYFMTRMWINKLKGLPRIQQIEVEKKINDVFYAAEMEVVCHEQTNFIPKFLEESNSYYSNSTR